MTDTSPSPPTTTAAPAPPGPRLESLMLLAWLATDLLSGVFHLVTFAFTRTAQRNRLREAMSVAAQELAP